MENKVGRFKQITEEMANTYEKKNHDYGDSFTELYAKLGPVSGLVPLNNKVDRITSLITKGGNNYESVNDTLKDLATYCVMFLMEYEEASAAQAAKPRRAPTKKHR